MGMCVYSNNHTKCIPESRVWPEKCEYCKHLGIECSPPERLPSKRLSTLTILEKSTVEVDEIQEIPRLDSGIIGDEKQSEKAKPAKRRNKRRPPASATLTSEEHESDASSTRETRKNIKRRR